MSTALGLALQITANSAQLATAVQDVNKRLDDMATAGKKSAKDLAVLKTIEISRVLIDGITAVAGAFASASRSAKALFDDSRAQIDALGKLSTQTQVSVEAIQAYSLAAAKAGLSSEEFAKSLQRLSVSVGKADGEKDTNPFAKLGLSVEELKAQNPEQLFESVAEALSSIANNQERAAIASEIFGKSGIRLLPLLNDGADGLRRAREEAEKLGGILKDEDVRNVEQMNDAFTEVGAAVQAIINQVVTKLAPPITAIADEFTAFVAQANAADIGGLIADRLLQFVEVFAETFRGVGKFLANFLEQLRQLVNNIPGINLETEADKERARLEARSGRDSEIRGEIAATQERIASDLKTVASLRAKDDPRTAEKDAAAIRSREERIARDRQRLELLQTRDLPIEGLSEASAARLEQLRNGATSFSDAIDSAADSVTNAVRGARQSIADNRAQPLDVGSAVAGAEAVVDGVAESNAELVEATEEQTEELRGLRRDLGNQPQTVEIAG